MNKFTEAGNKMLECLIAGDIDSDNPFVRDGGATYLRYDGLVIETSTKGFGGVNVCFMWRGHACYKMNVDGPGMDGGASLTLNGIEGRTRINLTGV